MLSAPIKKEFTPKIGSIYPPHNFLLFEEYFLNRFLKEGLYENLSREYLPIMWTGLYCNRNYGKGDLSDLQSYLENLDKNKKYFTVVQYDDNILNDLKDLDVLIFAQGGYGRYKDKCYPIPLNCMPSPNAKSVLDKDIFASFIGSIKGRHRIREKMHDVLLGNKKYLISETIDYGSFQNVMNRSLFSLCPRGYGQTSFRICEALQHRSIPVYIYDDALIPFYDIQNFEDYGVLIHENQIEFLDERLSSYSSEEISSKLSCGAIVYHKFYDYNGCYEKIIKKLSIKHASVKP